MGVVDFLKSFTVTRVTGHIAHEQDHGGRILERRVHTNGRVGRAWPTGDKTHAWAPGQFAVGLGHEGRPALLAAGDEAQTVLVLVQAVEHSQITLARHAKRMGNALGQEAFDKEVARNSCGHAGIVPTEPAG